jgi:aconitate hydratase
MGVQAKVDPFNVQDTIDTPEGPMTIYRLDRLEKNGFSNIAGLPFSIKVILEALLRNLDNNEITLSDVEGLANWNAIKISQQELPFKPARVVMQDFTGVPAVVDLAAMRSAYYRIMLSENSIETVKDMNFSNGERILLRIFMLYRRQQE